MHVYITALLPEFFTCRPGAPLIMVERVKLIRLTRTAAVTPLHCCIASQVPCSTEMLIDSTISDVVLGRCLVNCVTWYQFGARLNSLIGSSVAK